jgi:uncharacterized protein (DUF111 family)
MTSDERRLRLGAIIRSHGKVAKVGAIARVPRGNGVAIVPDGMNIDDMSPELHGYLFERLLSAGRTTCGLRRS